MMTTSPATVSWTMRSGPWRTNMPRMLPLLLLGDHAHEHVEAELSDGPAGVVRDVDHHLLQLLAREVAALERLLEVRAQRILLEHGEQDGEGHQAPVADRQALAPPHVA